MINDSQKTPQSEAQTDKNTLSVQQIKKRLKHSSKGELVNIIINLSKRVDEFKSLCNKNNIDYSELGAISG